MAARGGLDDLVDELSPYGYRPSTMEELTDAVMNSTYPYESSPWFFEWAAGCLRKKAADRKTNENPGRKKAKETSLLTFLSETKNLPDCG